MTSRDAPARVPRPSAVSPQPYPLSVDDELVEAAKVTIARQHGIPESRAHRLVGDTSEALHRDAKALARELNVLDPTERARDDGGKFSGVDMNQLVREASGR
jgi:hypothetical protein